MCSSWTGWLDQWTATRRPDSGLVIIGIVIQQWTSKHPYRFVFVLLPPAGSISGPRQISAHTDLVANAVVVHQWTTDQQRPHRSCCNCRRCTSVDTSTSRQAITAAVTEVGKWAIAQVLLMLSLLSISEHLNNQTSYHNCCHRGRQLGNRSGLAAIAVHQWTSQQPDSLHNYRTAIVVMKKEETRRRAEQGRWQSSMEGHNTHGGTAAA